MGSWVCMFRFSLVSATTNLAKVEHWITLLCCEWMRWKFSLPLVPSTTSQWKWSTDSHCLFAFESGYKLSTELNLLIPPAGGIGAPPTFSRQKVGGQFPTQLLQKHFAGELERWLSHPCIRGVKWKNNSLLSSPEIMLWERVQSFCVWPE